MVSKAGSFSLQPLACELQLIEDASKSVSVLITELNALVKVRVKSVPEDVGNRVAVLVRRSIEQVRNDCYRDKGHYVQGKARVIGLLNNLLSIVQGAAKVPNPLLFRALEEFSHTEMSTDAVIETVTHYPKLPEERILGFPEEFRVFARDRVSKALEKIPAVLHADGPSLYQEAMERELALLEDQKPQMIETLNHLDEIREFLDPDMDGSALLPLAIKYFDDPTFRQVLYLECRKITLKFYTEGLKKRGWPHFDLFEHVEFTDEATTYDAKAHEARKQILFDKVVRPSAAILFCRNLSLRKDLSFGQLLSLYETFTSKWQKLESYTFQTVEDLLQIADLCPETKELSLVPEIKTFVCHDTRKYPVHLKKIDPNSLYTPIPPSSVTHKGKCAPVYHGFSGDQGIVCGISYDFCSSQGRRKAMEDAHLITSLTLSDGTVCPFFAVMDGHSSSIVSEYLKEVLAPTVQAWLSVAIREKDFDVAIKNAMKIGMIQLNHLLKATFGTVLDRTGSNALFCFIYRERLFTVNIGDSRAVTSSGLQLSLDACASSEVFREKVRNRNGIILTEGTFKGRLNFHLLTFSTFGDFAEPSLRAFAKTHILKLEKGKNLTVALCCDGVTDTLTTAEICYNLLQGNSAFHIALEAYKQGSEDNLTCIRFQIP